MTQLTLDDLRPEEKAVVLNITAHGPLRKRIAEMGFSRGTVVEMIRRAPMNDPLEFRVRGYCITLRQSEARLIAAEKVEG